MNKIICTLREPENRENTESVTAFSSGEEQASGDAGSAIKIDPGVLHEKHERYSSLTDENHVALFTNRYEEAVKRTLANEKKKSEALEQRLFTPQMQDLPDREAKLKSQLFVNAGTEYKKAGYVTETSYDGIVYASIGLACVIFAAVMITRWDKRKKRRQKDAADNYTYR
jgi:hypothetical protein